MAKRRRLTPEHIARPVGGPAPAVGWDVGDGSDGAPRREAEGGEARRARRDGRAPIADVAGAVAGEAAADEIGAELIAARAEGRLVQALPLRAIEADHLLRDRMPEAADPEGEEMRALIASIRASGQRAPIETVGLGGGRYGLVSGWRRLSALRHLAERGEGPGTVLAIVRPAREAATSYLAMVEENEIRAPLSFWERARLVARAAGAGVFEDEGAALKALFASAPRARRSKIGAFLPVVAALEGALPFPLALTERTGLALSKAIREDAAFGPALAAALRSEPPADAAEQSDMLEAALRPAGSKARDGRPAAKPRRGPGEVIRRRDGARLVLEGPAAADPGFEDRLRRWLDSASR